MQTVAVATWGTDEVYRATGPIDDEPAFDVRAAIPDIAEHVASALAGRSFATPFQYRGRSGVCSFAPLLDAEGNVAGAVAVAVDTTPAAAKLRERLAFEDLITDLSTRFVTLSAEAIDRELNDALGTIGAFSGVDRAYIFRFTPDRRAMDNTHEWCAEGVVPQIELLQGLSLETLPWWAERMRLREVIHLADVDALPPEAAAEKRLLQGQDIQSLLVIPMVCEDTCVGFVGFDSVRKKKNWPKKDIVLLRIAGEIFVSAIERARADDERRRLEVQLVQARSLENVARLAGGVAHDFNNLLAVILNYATLLKREITIASQREKVEDLFDAARRAADLTRQLLLVGRRDVVEPMLLDLSAVVTALGMLLEQTLGERVQLRLELGEDLDIVRLGLPQIERVILNLTLNARDAMTNGGTVVVRTENLDVSAEMATGYLDLHPGRYVRMRVTDDGEGMTPEVASRAFEPFFTTKGASGTGLGLSTVHGIVKQSGGLVMISSKRGEGTTIDILFPVFSRDAEADAVDRPPPASSPCGRGETVLVVDDSAGVRKLVCAMLAENRYHPIEAATVEAAMAACERHPGEIDILLTDVIMPQMSGRDLAVRLLDAYGIDRVLYMSGYDNDVVAPHGVLEEGVFLLQKPFLEGDLLRALRAVLDADRDAGEGRISA